MKTGTMEPVAEFRRQLLSLLGRIVKLKARNIRAAEWEVGILEEVRFRAADDSGDVIAVRMKGGTLHELCPHHYRIEER